jgi:hypothetical protein
LKRMHISISTDLGKSTEGKRDLSLDVPGARRPEVDPNHPNIGATRHHILRSGGFDWGKYSLKFERSEDRIAKKISAVNLKREDLIYQSKRHRD